MAKERSCGENHDGFGRMFLQSEMARRFEIGDVSIVAGKSGLEQAYMGLSAIDHKEELLKPVWREDRSGLYWSGWALAYYQWYTAQPFSVIWSSISIRMLQKMHPAYHEADIAKAVETLSEMQKPVKKTSISILRLVRGLTQQELADRAHMSIS